MINYLKLNNRVGTVLFSILHFCVDGLCALLVFIKLYPYNVELSIYTFLAYNILAFVFQPLVGIIADKWLGYKEMLGISLILIILAYLVSDSTIISPILLGLGNAFFHISGGKYVITRTKNDIFSLGVFVSTGAMGLFLGTNYYSIILLVILIIIVIITSTYIFLSKEECLIIDKTINHPKKSELLILVLIILVVLIRSFIGKVVPIRFEKTPLILFIISLSIVLGKMLGGLSVKIIGVKLTIIFSMIISTICLAFGNSNYILYIIGLFFFNFTMPITLYYMNILLKGREGLSFGILAGALYPGYMLGLIAYSQLFISIMVIVLSIFSLVVVLIAEKRIHDD